VVLAVLVLAAVSALALLEAVTRILAHLRTRDERQAVAVADANVTRLDAAIEEIHRRLMRLEQSRGQR
jgi:hypothetical protein